MNDRIYEIKQEIDYPSALAENLKAANKKKSNGSSSAIAANVARFENRAGNCDADEDELKKFRLTKELARAKAELEALN